MWVALAPPHPAVISIELTPMMDLDQQASFYEQIATALCFSLKLWPHSTSPVSMVTLTASLLRKVDVLLLPEVTNCVIPWRLQEQSHLVSLQMNASPLSFVQPPPDSITGSESSNWPGPMPMSSYACYYKSQPCTSDQNRGCSRN